ncbi:bifunctional DNA primase/polymerase [Stenotrophomonas sp. NPDC077461]|uniref:bifunctional DNA primase/polymerase n=1 Tax=Stenotrophomonas sp. NPDC077461 TaxID=3414698 RepID=UPI003C2C6A09
MAAQENGHGVLDRGRKVTTDRETEPARAHGINDAVGRSSPTPSFDVDGLIRAGLTLIPLHRWDAKDTRGRDRGKTPRDGAWQSREYDSREVVEQARRDGRNVGVRLPPTWMVLDVDPRNFGGKDDPDNAAGRDPLAELARDAMLDLSACPHVVTGSGGHHYWFRKPADVQLLDSLETYPGVEFKSHGRQVVAPGSVHPNGRRYEWDDLAPFPEEAPQVPDALLRLARRPVRAHGEAAGLGELTPEMLAASLEHLDPCDFQDHDSQWLPLMMACHHATNGEGRQEFIDWSTQDPRYSDEGWLNMWKGWSVEPRPGDWSLLRELIRDVLTDGDAASFEYVLNWMAFMFQHPERVAEVAVAFRGAKGTGKSTLGRALAKLAGASGLHIANPSQLVGRFNSHLQNCILLFADEAFWAGDKAGESVLKALVTEPTLIYEGKGRDAVMGRNHVHIVMASNNDWVVPAGMDGERRFAVFNVNERRLGDKEFFNALNRQLDEGGLAGLLHDMLARDLGDWHSRESVPQTEALAEQKLMSQSAEESWWDGLLEAGRLPNFLGDLPWDTEAVEVDKDELHGSINRGEQELCHGRAKERFLQAGRCID